MQANHMWSDIERKFLEDTYNRGLPDTEIVKAMRAAGYDRSLTAIKSARCYLDLTMPANPDRLPNGKKSIEQQDDNFCRAMQEALDTGKEFGGWTLVKGKWSRAYVA